MAVFLFGWGCSDKFYRAGTSLKSGRQLEREPRLLLRDDNGVCTGKEMVGELEHSLRNPVKEKIAAGGVASSMTLRMVPANDAVMIAGADRKSTRLNSSHVKISYAVFCLKKKIHSGLIRILKKSPILQRR